MVITSNWESANWPAPIWPGVLLPGRGSVVAYPQVARTERGLRGTRVLPRQVTVAGDSWEVRCIAAVAGGPPIPGGSWTAVRPDSQEPVAGTAPKPPVLARAQQIKTQPAKELNAATARATTTAAVAKTDTTTHLEGVFSDECLGFRIHWCDVSKGPSGSWQQASLDM